MRRLSLPVRVKAIEIANAMLAEGYEEGQAIRMAIAAAKKWARRVHDPLPVLRVPPSRGAGSAQP
jgi:uncharacterized protein YdaT